jgi:hypothetical protein
VLGAEHPDSRNSARSLAEDLHLLEEASNDP